MAAEIAGLIHLSEPMGECLVLRLCSGLLRAASAARRGLYRIAENEYTLATGARPFHVDP